MAKIKVRYGPSPTGIPHIGNIRTALFNYLLAKNQNGEFYLRIEDTDQARIVDGAVEKIKESLNILGLNWDGEIIYQSKRLSIYKKYLNELKEKHFVYEEEGAWRFKVDTTKQKISWQDVVHGKVEFPANVVEDFIIIKSDGYPTYHFASVVDDHEMQISHVIRGDEWISSTPKHIALYEAFGWQHPEFVHLPPILGADHKKLSKRDGAKSTIEYIEEGYLPEAIVNFLSLLGWSPKSNQEVFSLEQLTQEFSLDRINKNSPIFNVDKLNWFNSQWIRKIPDTVLIQKIQDQNLSWEKSQITKILPIVKDRINFVSDFKKMANMFFVKPDTKNHIKEISISAVVLEKIISTLEKIKNWKDFNIKESVIEIMAGENLEKPQLYRSLGIMLSGELVTPPIFPSMELLGSKETIKRLKNAAEKIKN